MMDSQRPPLPPFTSQTAAEKVRLAEDGWNSRDPGKVALAYTADSQWPEGYRPFPCRKVAAGPRLPSDQGAVDVQRHRIAVRFAYEWHDDSGNWFRSFGNKNWEFNDSGLMRKQYACINYPPIRVEDRRFHWPLGRRPDDHPGLSALGF